MVGGVLAYFTGYRSVFYFNIGVVILLFLHTFFNLRGKQRQLECEQLKFIKLYQNTPIINDNNHNTENQPLISAQSNVCLCLLASHISPFFLRNCTQKKQNKKMRTIHTKTKKKRREMIYKLK